MIKSMAPDEQLMLAEFLADSISHDCRITFEADWNDLVMLLNSSLTEYFSMDTDDQFDKTMEYDYTPDDTFEKE